MKVSSSFAFSHQGVIELSKFGDENDLTAVASESDMLCFHEVFSFLQKKHLINELRWFVRVGIATHINNRQWLN